MRKKSALLIMLLLSATTAFSIVLTTITIDGIFTDWDFVLSDNDNILPDPFRNAGDGDSATISSDANDVRLIATTWDLNNIYFYFQTSKANSSSLTFLVYVDGDHDGKLEDSASADKVLSYKYVSSGIQSVALYYYVPVNSSGDVMGGDGSGMPGSLTYVSAPSSMTGAIGSTGVEFEAKISWTDLGLPGKTATQVKVSTQVGSNINDNTGLLDLLIPKVSVTPDNSANTKASSIVQYTHTVTNQSTGNDVLNVTASSSQGYSISFLRWDGSAFVSMLDADSNGTPDFGTMPSGGTALLQVTIYVPASATTQTLDVTTVFATSSVNSSVLGAAKDTTTVGDITVGPDQSKSSVAGVTIGYKHEISNHTSSNFTLGLSTGSNPAWSTAIYTDTNCDGVAEGSPIVSIAVSANSFKCVVAALTIPGGTPSGTVNILTLTATNSSPALTASATDTTTVADAVVVAPDNTATITGAGSSTYYSHTITNNQVVSDSFNLTAVPSQPGWTAQVYADDGVTQISSVGPLPAFGGTAKFKIRVTASGSAPVGSTDTTTVTGVSTSGPANDTALDVTSIRQVATYLNFGATLPSTTFSPCTTVFAKGYNLTGTDYRVRWIDPGNIIKSQITGVRPNGNNQIIDSYQLLTNDALGSWTVEIATKQGSGYGNPTYTGTFQVVSAGIINFLMTNRSTYYYQGNTVTVTSSVTNQVAAPYNNAVINYVIYKDVDSSGTVTNGDLFLMSNGLVGTYDGTVVTHTTNLVDIAANATVQDQFSVANTDFGSGNTGTWRVDAEWKTSCGGSVANTSSLNVTFQVVVNCTIGAGSIVKPIRMQKFGVNQYLITWSAVAEPCFLNYTVLGSTTPNPADWTSLTEANTPGIFYLGSLSNKYYQIIIKSIDGTYGPR